MALKTAKATTPPESVAQSAAPDINLEDALIACFLLLTQEQSYC